jgi:hypothetical protein
LKCPTAIETGFVAGFELGAAEDGAVWPSARGSGDQPTEGKKHYNCHAIWFLCAD